MLGDNVHPSSLSFNVDDSGRFLPSDTELGHAVNCSGSVAKIEEITQILHHSQHLWPGKKKEFTAGVAKSWEMTFLFNWVMFRFQPFNFLAGLFGNFTF